MRVEGNEMRDILCNDHISAEQISLLLSGATSFFPHEIFKPDILHTVPSEVSWFGRKGK